MRRSAWKVILEELMIENKELTTKYEKTSDALKKSKLNEVNQFSSTFLTVVFRRFIFSHLELILFLYFWKD